MVLYEFRKKRRMFLGPKNSLVRGQQLEKPGKEAGEEQTAIRR